MLNIPKDFKEFIQLLNLNNVRYLVVGGYAVAYHGHPRSTGDIDFFLECTSQNALVVKKCLDDFGFRSLDITVKDLSTPNQIIQMGYPPLRIDLLTSIDGISFKEAWINRDVVELEKLTINFINKTDLNTNKLSTGRLKDQADAEELK
ncbi:MAG TPA: hypothetical protein DCO79_13530 [Spirochaeta sp.]|nr:hypothetical protein [Spirochaeta sp.]